MTTNGFLTNGNALKANLGMAAYRAPSLLQPHRARQAIADAHSGKIPPLIAYYSGLASTAITKLVAQLGFDMVWIDWEHAAMGVETMTQMVHDIQFMSEGRSIAIVRVPGHDHAALGYALDAGASVMVPQVDTVEQAKHIVSAKLFGSKLNGTRSWPPARLSAPYSTGLVNPNLPLAQNVNDQAALFIQTESMAGIDNLDAILTETGEYIDGVWLGQLDLRASMGLAGIFGDEPEYVAAVAKWESIVRKHDKALMGPLMGTPEVQAEQAKGKAFLLVAWDFFTLLTSATPLAYARETFPAENWSAINATLRGNGFDGQHKRE